MATDIKTLKDFDWDGIHSFGINEVVKDELKQEAIKDIKSFGSGKTLFFENGEDINAPEACAICEYIKWKFNITDKELNDTKRGEN